MQLLKVLDTMLIHEYKTYKEITEMTGDSRVRLGQKIASLIDAGEGCIKLERRRRIGEWEYRLTYDETPPDIQLSLFQC